MSERAELRRGWCPSPLRPMPSGDGLLLRLHFACYVLPPELARGIAGCARRFGNGLVDLTRHGNLQLRGVTEPMLAALRDELAALLPLPAEDEAEAAQNVMGSPLAGIDPNAACDIRPIVAALQERLARDPALRALPARFSFVVDDGGRLGLDGIAADLRFKAMRAPGRPRFAIALGGTADEAVSVGSCAAPELPAAAVAFARAFLALRGAGDAAARRMRELVDRIGAEAIAEAASAIPVVRAPSPACGRRCRHEVATDEGRRRSASPRPHPPLADARGTFSRKREKGRVPLLSRRADGELLVGFHRLDDAHGFLGIGAPFGRLSADQLERLAYAAEGAELRLTPWRAIAIAPIDAAQAEALRASLASVGLITEAGDPLLAVAACPGAPACANATVPTREDALRLASAARELAQTGIGLHLSGCPKGCAKSDATAATLVGRDGHYDLILDGRPGDAPSRFGLTAGDAETLLREIGAERRRGGAAPQGKIGIG